MRILVTGSSGFIGFHLTKKLLKLNHKVIGIDNHNDYYDVKLKETRNKLLLSKNFNFYKQDLNNLSIPNKEIDIAINLAAQAGVRLPKSKQYLYGESNINGFEAFCKFCESRNIKKIIYASSSSVYSDEDGDRFSEIGTKLKPKSLYGESKLHNELYASKFSKKTKSLMLGIRFFSVYGPYGRPDMAYFSFTEAIKKNKTIKLNNKGAMQRDMTYIDDVIEGLCGSISYINKKDKLENELINLGNDHPIDTRELLKTLEKSLDKKTNINFVKTKNEAVKTHADITKAKNLLGYEPKVNFYEGISRFIKWHNNYEKS
ncbi:MAG: hypothetical protein CMM96_00750 [Rickettsiales bacterium]|nr:hypothetical protein [Rickettsiales bacterium]|tara:strand:+ start:6323 stop:7270 length:948 start_codon:yes stop_codon:yes gene_type:complete